MAQSSVQKSSHVFVNCPFDGQYKGLFDAIVFAVFDCGFTPRCAKEVIDSGTIRIVTIERIIEECKFGIHDLSRIELNENGLPRFNMPLELGLFLGAKGILKDTQISLDSIVMQIMSRDSAREAEWASIG